MGDGSRGGGGPAIRVPLLENAELKKEESIVCKQFACTSQAEISMAEKTMVTWNKSGY
jgi:hypothetical protein